VIAVSASNSNGETFVVTDAIEIFFNLLSAWIVQFVTFHCLLIKIRVSLQTN